jgi:transcriptional regulator with XRE-family HTH domain
MMISDILKLPRGLARVREAAGLSQRSLAASLGVHPTYLCGLEKGRRQLSNGDLLGQLEASIALPTEQLDQLRWALAHDQVIKHAHAHGVSDRALELISLALQLERELADDVVEGYRQSMATGIQSGRFLHSRAADARAQKLEGTSMT